MSEWSAVEFSVNDSRAGLCLAAQSRGVPCGWS